MPDDGDKVPDVKLLKPHQLGWLRRPELDTETAHAWEQPDGKLHAQPKHIHLVLRYLKYPKYPKVV